MVTFTRLLVISIVASVRSESSRSSRILRSESFLSSSSSLRSVGESEKNAISDPEAKPEKISNIPAIKIAISAPKEGVMIVTSFRIC